MDLRRIFWIVDTKNSRALVEKWAEQAGKKADKIITWSESNFTDTSDQLAAAYWLLHDTKLKVDVIKRALYICKQLKLDPLKQNPKELIEQNPSIKPKEKPINPDDVLTDRQEDGEGNVTYAARDEDRKILRQIINTHYGEDTSPWCLLQGDSETGKLTRESGKYWKEYSAYPKRVAFRNGKLLAFSAGKDKNLREWWDRFDRSFPFIPYNGKTWEGSNGYTYEIRNFHVFKKRGDIESRLSSEYATDISKAVAETSIDRQRRMIGYKGMLYPYEERDGKYVCTEGYSPFNRNKPIKCLMTFTKDLLLDGPYEYYHENGQLNEKCTFKNGKKEGPYESYYSNGQLEVKCTYKNGKLEGLYESYYSNGQLNRKYTYKNGKKEGPYESYYSNGQLKEKSTYKNAKLEGPHEDYYKNGQLWSKCAYKDDRLDGLSETYHENGQLWAKCTYKNNKLEGPYEQYYKNGQLREKCTYKNGKEDGLYVEYRDNGQLKRKGIYVNGKLVRNVE